MDKMYSAREASKRIGVSKQRIFDYIKQGKLSVQYVDGRAYLPIHEVEAFIRPNAQDFTSQERPEHSNTATLTTQNVGLYEKLIPIIGDSFKNIARETSQGLAQSLTALFQAPPEKLQSLYDRILHDPVGLSDETIEALIPESVRQHFTPEELEKAKQDTRELAPMARQEALKHLATTL